MNKCLAITLIFFISLMVSGLYSQATGTEYISIEGSNMDLARIIKMITKYTGVNIITHKSVRGQVTLKLKDVYYEKALELICKTNNLAFRKIGNTYVVAPSKELSDAFDVGLNQVFRLQFATADDVSGIIKGVFKGADSKVDVSVDKRNNAIVVSGTQDTIDQVAKLIKNIDVPVHQVMIEAKIVEVQSETLRNIGFSWSWGIDGTSGTSTGSGQVLAMNETLAPVPNADAYQNFGTSKTDVFKVGDFFRAPLFFSTLFNALAKTSDAKVLSNPKISSLNGQKANINIGEKVIYGGGADTPPQEKDVGVKLDVTPQINDDGYITVKISPEVSIVRGRDDVTNYPIIVQRKCETQVRVKDGEEILIGGLIQEQENISETKTPILGDIPILKTFFRSRNREVTNKELIILVTPHIMRRVSEG
ncbi:hypothetical protein KAJ27_16045 [bacterium]|nr:hypothetical protein [bacterium]